MVYPRVRRARGEEGELQGIGERARGGRALVYRRGKREKRGSRHGLVVQGKVAVFANLPTCQLVGFSTCREVGDLESWRGAGAGAVAGERNGYRVGAEMKRKGQADGLPGGVSEGGTSWPR